MQIVELVPATLIALVVVAGSVAAQVMPVGEASLLVRVPPDVREAPLLAAASAGATLVAIPASGYAILHGNAARIRAASGLAIVWQGKAPCSSSS